MSGFVIADYAVFSISIIVSLGIGIYYALSGGRQKTTSEYLVGNRKMQILPVALSLMVSFESSIMMLGFPAETYVYGIMFWLSNFGFMFANLIAVRIVVPLVHPLKITSVYEVALASMFLELLPFVGHVGYFELRFKSKSVRMFGTVLGMLNYIFYMGVVLFGPGIALESVTNFPMWASILCVALASVIYTSIGGIKAVIWTDVFQCAIMFIGIFAVIIKGTMVSGGVSGVIEINRNSGRLNLFDFNTDPTVRHTFWNLVVGSCIRMTGMCFNQSTIQRICATPKQKDANKVLYFVGPAFFITLSLATLEGLIAYAYFYSIGCDPLRSKDITNPNQVIPYMVLDIFKQYPGMPGLFMASLFSASLSTMSSGLSSLSAVTVQDIVRPVYKNISEAKSTMIAKLSVVVFGALSVGVSFIVAEVKGPMSQIASSMLSAFGGPMTGLFLYSIFCPWATARGSFVGALVSFIFILWISTGQNFSGSLTKTPWLPLGPVDQCSAMGIENHTANWYMNRTDHYSATAFSAPILEESTPSVINISVPEGPQGIDKMYSLSYQWFQVVGIFVTIVIGTIVSLIEGRPDPKKVDVRYMLPFYDQVFPCLPKSLRKLLYCGAPFEKRKLLLERMNKAYDEYEKGEITTTVLLDSPNNQADVTHDNGLTIVPDKEHYQHDGGSAVLSSVNEERNGSRNIIKSNSAEDSV